MTEAEICRKLVRPRVEAAGRDASLLHFCSGQVTFIDGRIITPGGKPVHLKKKIANSLLRSARDVTLGVVEAKSDQCPAGDCLQRHRHY